MPLQIIVEVDQIALMLMLFLLFTRCEKFHQLGCGVVDRYLFGSCALERRHHGVALAAFADRMSEQLVPFGAVSSPALFLHGLSPLRGQAPSAAIHSFPFLDLCEREDSVLATELSVDGLSSLFSLLEETVLLSGAVGEGWQLVPALDDISGHGTYLIELALLGLFFL